MRDKDSTLTWGHGLHLSLLALICLTPWALLLVSGELLFPYVTTKVYAFRSLVAVILPLWVALAVYDQRARVNWRHPVIMVFAGLLIWTMLTNAVGIDPRQSFWSSLERSEGGILLWHLFGYFIVCASMLTTQKRRLMVLLSFCCVILVIAVIGWSDLEPRAHSVLGNPIYYGNLAVFGIFLSLFVVSLINSRRNSVWLWAGWLIVTAALVYSVFLSATRASLLALFAACLVCIFTALTIKVVNHQIRAGLLAALLLSIAIGAFGMANYRTQIASWQWVQDSYLLSRIAKISTADQTTSDRFANWRVAIDAATQHPWMGWGQDNYPTAFLEHYRAGALDYAKIWFDRAHNAFLDWLVAAGLPGLTLYLALIAVAVWATWYRTPWGRAGKMAITGFLVAYLAKNLTGFDTLPDYLLLVLVLALIVSAQPHKAMKITSQSKVTPRPLLVSLCLIAGLGIAYLSNWQPFQANQKIRLAAQWIKLANQYPHLPDCDALPTSVEQAERDYCNHWAQDRFQPSHRYAPALRIIQSAYDTDPNIGHELFILLRGVALTKQREVDVQQKQQMYQVLDRLAQAELDHNPRNWMITFYWAVWHADRDEFDQALRLMNQLVLAAPNKTLFHVTHANILFNAGRVVDAEAALAKADRLNAAYAKTKLPSK